MAEGGVADTDPDDVDTRPSRGREADERAGEVVTDQHEVGLAPRGQGEGRLGTDLRPDPRRRTEGDDRVVDGRGPGDQEDGHATRVGGGTDARQPTPTPLVDNDDPAPPVDT